MLESFITDFYSKDFILGMARFLPCRLAESINGRHCDGIMNKNVRSQPGAFLASQIFKGSAQSRFFRGAKYARTLSLAAAKMAKARKSSLLLYSSYAYEAFLTSFSHTPKRVLFQYHPHYDYEREIYKQYAPTSVVESASSVLKGHPELLKPLTDAWQHSDLILCASTFTKQSLIWAGADENICRVIPYGCDFAPLNSFDLPADDCFQAIFVGSGITRKGLDCLLKAWKHVSFQGPKKLVVICRGIAPEIRKQMGDTPDVVLLPGVLNQELISLYSRSHLFVMPSLIEGFGQVYLEALACGCPVLGTANTVLPDLGNESNGIFMVPPGDWEQLSVKLSHLASTLTKSHSNIRIAARKLALQFTWKRFRDGVINSIT